MPRRPLPGGTAPASWRWTGLPAAWSTGIFMTCRIIFAHIMPNAYMGILASAAVGFNNAVIAEAGLSFLGLGVPSPTPEWGAIISGGKSFISTAWWITVCPGLVMVFVGLGFSLLGDGLNDLLRTKD